MASLLLSVGRRPNDWRTTEAGVSSCYRPDSAPLQFIYSHPRITTHLFFPSPPLSRHSPWEQHGTHISPTTFDLHIRLPGLERSTDLALDFPDQHKSREQFMTNQKVLSMGRADNRTVSAHWKTKPISVGSTSLSPQIKKKKMWIGSILVFFFPRWISWRRQRQRKRVGLVVYTLEQYSLVQERAAFDVNFCFFFFFRYKKWYNTKYRNVFCADVKEKKNHYRYATG